MDVPSKKVTESHMCLSREMCEGANLEKRLYSPANTFFTLMKSQNLEIESKYRVRERVGPAQNQVNIKP